MKIYMFAFFLTITTNSCAFLSPAAIEIAEEVIEEIAEDIVSNEKTKQK